MCYSLRIHSKAYFLHFRSNNEDNINISISNASKLTKNMNISISMTSDPVAPQLAPTTVTPTMAASANQDENVKANIVGVGLKKVPAVSQPPPPNGSPLVDLVDDTDSDDCELERKKEEAAVVSFTSSFSHNLILSL